MLNLCVLKNKVMLNSFFENSKVLHKDKKYCRVAMGGRRFSTEMGSILSTTGLRSCYALIGIAEKDGKPLAISLEHWVGDEQSAKYCIKDTLTQLKHLAPSATKLSILAYGGIEQEYDYSNLNQEILTLSEDSTIKLQLIEPPGVNSISSWSSVCLQLDAQGVDISTSSHENEPGQSCVKVNHYCYSSIGLTERLLEDNQTSLEDNELNEDAQCPRNKF